MNNQRREREREMETMRKEGRTYCDGEPPEDVEGDEARPPGGGRFLFLLRGIRGVPDAGLDVILVRGQQRVVRGGDDVAELVVRLGRRGGLVALDEFVHHHLSFELHRKWRRKRTVLLSTWKERRRRRRRKGNSGES